jgi:folate-binding protein YgfZ
MSVSPLPYPDYAVIAVSGPDSAEFLQGQLTADLNALDDGADPALAAWCNPKGRVITLLRLRQAGDQYRLALPSELAEPVVRRLAMFRFRSKVDFAVEAATADDLGAADGETAEAWSRRQFEAGVAEIGAAQSEAFTPHMLNLDLLGAISFDKGCYTGQEIVARTHYRGATRRRMLRFGYPGSATAGDKLTLDERAVGEVVNVLAGELLAVAPLENAEGGLTVNDEPVTLLDLPYL